MFQLFESRYLDDVYWIPPLQQIVGVDFYFGSIDVVDSDMDFGFLANLKINVNPIMILVLDSLSLSDSYADLIWIRSLPNTSERCFMSR